MKNYKELFRTACYLITSEQSCSKSLLQRRLNIGYNDATFIFKMLLENQLITEKKNYTPIFKTIGDLEIILDKIYK